MRIRKKAWEPVGETKLQRFPVFAKLDARSRFFKIGALANLDSGVFQGSQQFIYLVVVIGNFIGHPFFFLPR